MGKVVKKIGKTVGKVAGGVLGAVTGTGGADAAKDATKAQINASNDALAFQKKIYDDMMAQQAPFRQAGLSAQNRLLDYLGLQNDPGTAGFGKYTGDFSMQDFQQDPGYSFRLNEGLKALDRQAAARGGLISGGALKAAQRYGQDMASQEYQNAFNRYQVNRSNQLNPLQSFLGVGQTATNALGNYGQNYGQQTGDLLTGMGNARASGYVGAANAYSGAVNNLAKIGTNIFTGLGL